MHNHMHKHNDISIYIYIYLYFHTEILILGFEDCGGGRGGFFVSGSPNSSVTEALHKNIKIKTNNKKERKRKEKNKNEGKYRALYVCVCLRVCVHTYAWVCMWVGGVRVFLWQCDRVCMCACACACVSVSLCVRLRVWVRAQRRKFSVQLSSLLSAVCALMHVCACAFKQSDIFIPFRGSGANFMCRGAH